MLEINIATERRAADHDGRMPNQLTDLKGYIAPMTLICPASRPASLLTS
jgi:hypothetical protein